MGNFFSSDEPEQTVDNINLKNGAYIFWNNKNIHRFNYYQMPKTQLQEALPISYVDNPDKDYLTVIFDESGKDYLGQASYQDILALIRKSKMTNLLETPIEKIKNDFNLEEKDIINMRDFARSQLEEK